MITKMQIDPYQLFMKQKRKSQAEPIKTANLQIPEVRRNYMKVIKEKFGDLNLNKKSKPMLKKNGTFQ